MFANNVVLQSTTDNYFIDNRNKIEVIFPSSAFKINVVGDCGSPTTHHNNYLLIVEKINCQSILQLRITDLSDQSKMFLSTVDGILFEQIKKEQLLHVSFSGFVDNLLVILKSCKSGDLFINLFAGNNRSTLQFCEVRSFKNLVHLQLPIQQASAAIILYHINKTIFYLEKQQSSYENTVQYMQQEALQKDEQINLLRNEIKKLNISLTEEQMKISIQNNEEIKKLQQSMKNIADSKCAEENRFRTIISGLQSQIERLKKENTSLLEQKSDEKTKMESLQEEIRILKSKALERNEQNEKFHSEIAALKNFERKTEMIVNDLRKHLHESQESLRKQEKMKSDLTAELEAEKNICRTKRNALLLATEEISKSNDIIIKMSKELAEQQKKLDWRTEVALKQEITVKEREKQISVYTHKIQHLEVDLKKYKEQSKEFSKELDIMRLLANKIEDKYREKISVLAKQIEHIDTLPNNGLPRMPKY